MGCAGGPARGDWRVIVRPALLGDAERLPAVERSAAEAFRGQLHDWIADDSVAEPAFHAPLIEAGTVWVAETDGEMAGFVSCQMVDAHLHVWELAVALPFQRRGVGRALMACAIEHAQRMGLASVTLTTFENVSFNAPFYASIGFAMDEPPSPRLAGILDGERARGLTHRCAMRMDLQRSGGA